MAFVIALSLPASPNPGRYGVKRGKGMNSMLGAYRMHEQHGMNGVYDTRDMLSINGMHDIPALHV